MAGLTPEALTNLLDDQEDDLQRQVAKWLNDQVFPSLDPVVDRALQTKGVPAGPTVDLAGFLPIFERWTAQVYDLGMQSADNELAQTGYVAPEAVVTSRFVPTDAVEWARERGALMGKWPRDLDAAVKQVLTDGVEAGVLRTEMRANLKTVFADFGDARLRTIARTECTTTWSAGRRRTIQRVNQRPNNINPDNWQGAWITAAQSICIIDAVTTKTCESRNGKIIVPDTPQAANGLAPGHYNCRRVETYISRLEWAKLLAGDAKALAKRLGWTKFSTLEEALDWSQVIPPMEGFGSSVF